MAEYPPIRFPDSITGTTQIALPNGKFRAEFLEPQSHDRIGSEVPSAKPLFAEPTLIADFQFSAVGMPSIEEVRDLAASSGQIQQLLPAYVLDDHEFYPQRDSLTISADTPEIAAEIAAQLTEQAQAALGVDNELVFDEELFPGRFIYEVTGDLVEPGFVLHALEIANGQLEVGVVAIDAAHPDRVTLAGTCVGYTDYTARYDKPGNAPPLRTGAQAVAVIDSFFELDHPALNFLRKGEEPPRGISVTDKSQCAVTAHGTSCAGVIGASGVEAQQAHAEGSAPGVELLPIRIYEAGTASFQEKLLARGMEAAVDAGVGVISISLATPLLLGPLVGEAVKYAEQRNVVVVAGSGNNQGSGGNAPPPSADGPVEFPARFGQVLAVGAAGLFPNSTPQLRRSAGEPAMGGKQLWSSKYGLPGGEGTFRRGVSVVAQGMGVATTDLLNPPDPIDPADPANPGDFWTGFRATSASGPIVAGLAARLRAAYGSLSASGIRAQIECLAYQPKDFTAKQSFEIEGHRKRNYSDELGFGWIDRSAVDLDCETYETESPMTAPETETETGPSGTGPVDSEDCNSVECAGLPDKEYANLVRDCAQPLSVFLKTLADRRCCKLLYDFLDEPYLTARTAGVPYAGAVWLGTGDWKLVNRALMAEQGLVKENVAEIYAKLGPIWVKAL